MYSLRSDYSILIGPICQKIYDVHKLLMHDKLGRGEGLDYFHFVARLKRCITCRTVTTDRVAV